MARGLGADRRNLQGESRAARQQRRRAGVLREAWVWRGRAKRGLLRRPRRRRAHDTRSGRHEHGVGGTAVTTSDTRALKPLRVAVLTVSDTRDEATDKSGALLVERLRK